MALVDLAPARFDERMANPRNGNDESSGGTRHATVGECLTIHGDLYPDEIDTLIDHWAKLDARLRSFDTGAVRLDLYVKDRDKPSQHLTLEATIDRWPVLIASSDDADLDHALNMVRDEMIRLITDAKDRHSPRRRH